MLRVILSPALAATLVFTSSTAIAGKHYTARLGDRNTFSLTVEKIVFSPDSSQMLVATSTGTYIVQPQGANILGRIKMWPFSMNYSKDGSRAFLIGKNDQKLFDMTQGIEVKHDSTSTPGYVGVTIAPKNGKLIVSAIAPGSPCAKDGNIQVGDELIRVGEGSSGPMRSVEGGSVNGAIELITGPAGTTVRLTVIPDGEIQENTYELQRFARNQVNGQNVYVPISRTEVHENVVWCLSNDNHQFSSAKTGEPLSVFRPRNLTWDTGYLAISQDSRLFAWVGKYIATPENAAVREGAKVRDNMARVYAEREKERLSKRGGSPAGGAASESVQDDVAFGSSSRSAFGVEIHSIVSQDLLTTFSIADEPVNTVVSVPAFYGVQFSSDGKRLIVGTWSQLHVYDIETGQRVDVLVAPAQGGSRAVNTFAVSDEIAAVGDVDGKLHLLRLDTGEIIEEVESREKDHNVEELTFSPDGKWLAYVAGRVLHVLDVSDKSNVESPRDE